VINAVISPYPASELRIHPAARCVHLLFTRVRAVRHL